MEPTDTREIVDYAPDSAVTFPEEDLSKQLPTGTSHKPTKASTKLTRLLEAKGSELEAASRVLKDEMLSVGPYVRTDVAELRRSAANTSKPSEQAEEDRLQSVYLDLVNSVRATREALTLAEEQRSNIDPQQKAISKRLAGVEEFLLQLQANDHFAERNGIINCYQVQVTGYASKTARLEHSSSSIYALERELTSVRNELQGLKTSYSKANQENAHLRSRNRALTRQVKAFSYELATSSAFVDALLEKVESDAFSSVMQQSEDAEHPESERKE